MIDLYKGDLIFTSKNNKLPKIVKKLAKKYPYALVYSCCNADNIDMKNNFIYISFSSESQHKDEFNSVQYELLFNIYSNLNISFDDIIIKNGYFDIAKNA